MSKSELSLISSFIHLKDYLSITLSIKLLGHEVFSYEWPPKNSKI